MEAYDFRDLPTSAEIDSASAAILKNVRDPNQRAMIESTMKSPAWTVAGLSVLVREQRRELDRHRGLDAEAERVIAEAEKLRAKLKAAEDARKAAERVAEKERIARIGAEGLYDELLVALRDANEKESRLERLLGEHDAS